MVIISSMFAWVVSVIVDAAMLVPGVLDIVIFDQVSCAPYASGTIRPMFTVEFIPCNL